MARTITAPDDEVWAVRRRWIPRLGTETLWGRFDRRYRQVLHHSSRLADGADGCGDALAEGLVFALVLLAVVLLALFVVIPLLVIVVDLVVLVLLAFLGLLARAVLGRPWLVDAHAVDGPHLRWRVVGWRASGAKVDEVAKLLEAGIVPPDGEQLAGTPTDRAPDEGFGPRPDPGAGGSGADG